MSAPYAEILDGENVLRLPPGARHEQICARLHALLQASVAHLSGFQLLAPRTQVRLSATTLVCPDLAVVTADTGQLYLAVEIVDSEDHQADTVIKKQLYEDARLPRLWMIDPRYDNLEVYHGSEYGLMLKGILAGRESLTEQGLPEFRLTVGELFR